MTRKTGLTSTTRAILFDHDGTLIDSEKVHYDLWAQVMSEYGVTLTPDFYSDVMAGIPVDQNAVDVVEQYHLSAASQQLADRKHALTRDYLSGQAFPLMPYAIETIKKCYDCGYQLAIVTGGSKLSVKRTLEVRGVGHMFSAIVAVEDVKHSKPAPDCYQLAMQKLGRKPDECVAVEDTSHGMQSAVNAGIACVVIPTSHSQGHDFKNATTKYASLQEWLVVEL